MAWRISLNFCLAKITMKKVWTLLLDVMLPLQAELSYAFPDHSSIYVGADFGGEQYFRRLATENGGAEVDVQIQQLRTRGGFLYRFERHWSAFAELGATVAGNWELRTPTTTVDGDIESALFFRVGMGFHF